MRRQPLTKGHIRKIAIQVLTLQNSTVWAQNNVRAVAGRTFVGRKGVADIIGFHNYTGIFIMCEVKALGDKLSREQMDLLLGVALAGGQALIATEDKSGGVILVQYMDYIKKR